MPRLLIVHHTPSPAMHDLYLAVLEGARHPDLEGIEVTPVPALAAGPVDVLGSDGYLLGTPANLGYMSGALKHFFDQVYYPCLDATRGRPFGCWVHGNNDTTGAERAIETVTTGLGWTRAQATVSVVGPPGPGDLDACRELGAAVAAGLTPA